MYRSRRKRGAIGASGPRFRRPRSIASRVDSSRNIENSRRSPDSVYRRFLGAVGRFPGSATGMCESRTNRGAHGAHGPRIRMPGSMAIHLRFSGNLEKSRRPTGRLPETFLAKERLIGGASATYTSRGNAARAGRMAPESGGADPRPFSYGSPRGFGGFVGHSDLDSRTGFALTAPRLRLVSLSSCGSRLVLVAVVSLVLVCVVRVWCWLRWFR